MTTRLLWLCLGIGFATHAHAQQPLPVRAPQAQPTAKTGTGIIAGSVVSDDNPPHPIRKVRVTLNMVGRGMPGRTATTDDAGRFEFRDLPSGRFNLQAYRQDYVRTNYGARRPERSGTPVPLAEGERREGIVIPIAKGGAISGVVRDGSGTPVPGATVRTLSFGYSVLTGERTLGLQSSGGMVRTDDRGMYRAWGLAAGDYVIKVDPPVEAPDPTLDDMRLISAADVQRVLAEARGNGAGGFSTPATPSRSGSAPGAPVKYSPIYFPGTPEMVAAKTIALAAAEDRDGVDVQLSLARTSRVEGRVRVPEGAPAGPLNVTLAPTFVVGQTSLSQPDRPASTSLGRDGRFSFGGMAPGRYTITAKASGAAAWWAVADVVVDGSDLDVELDLHAPLTVKGQLVFDGATEPPKSFGGLRYALLPLGNGSMISNQLTGEVDPQGRFQIQGVVPGMYWWMSLSTAAGGLSTASGGDMARWSMKSVTANGRDASDGPLQIKSSDNNIDLIFSFNDRPTELTGTLQDASGRAASDYFVLAFPADKTLWTPRSRYIRSTRPGTDGQFALKGLPPGDYLIAALTDLASGDDNDPSLLASLVSASLKVTLVGGQQTTQDLRLAGK